MTNLVTGLDCVLGNLMLFSCLADNMTEENTMKANRVKIATTFLAVPGAMAMGLSANTSFRFMGVALKITDPFERGALCSVAEAAIIALTVYAWATATKFPAYLAYVAVLIQAIPAFKVSGGIGGSVRVALGPVLLAVILHLLLGLETKISKLRSDSMVRLIIREARTRFTAYFGIGKRGEDSAAIARSRAADRAVSLADVVASVDSKKVRKSARATAKLAQAIDGARHGLTPELAAQAESEIVARVNRRKSVSRLAGLKGTHRWTEMSPEPSTVSPEPEPLSPEPSTVSPEVEPLSPEPSTVSPEVEPLSPEPMAQFVSHVENKIEKGSPDVSPTEPSQVKAVSPVSPVVISVPEPVTVVSRIEPEHLSPVEPKSVSPEPLTKAQIVAQVAQGLSQGLKYTGASVAQAHKVSPATGKRYLAEARIQARDMTGTGMYS